jgi:hypothetical protein
MDLARGIVGRLGLGAQERLAHAFAGPVQQYGRRALLGADLPADRLERLALGVGEPQGPHPAFG